MKRTRRLAGIGFEAAPPAPAATLPRMDIAAFVGFASSGPLQSPVAVESVDEFADLFGPDLPLAWDKGAGDFEPAYLGPAVRDFFRNGGQRCWVIRVAGPSAVSNLFPLSNVYAREGNRLMPAFAQARSEGSWSDAVQLATALVSRGLSATPGRLAPVTAGTWVLPLSGGLPGEVQDGDLLRMRFSAEELSAMATVLEVKPSALTLDKPLWCATASESDVSAWSGETPDTMTESIPVVERLTFDLLARRGLDAPLRLYDLAFAPAAARYWRDLPLDSQISVAEGWGDALHPRFPVAGYDSGGEKCRPSFFPVGMPVVAGDYLPAQKPPGQPLERDGLAQFSSSLFLDRELADARLLDLMADADYIRYQSPHPRTLAGIHAALAVEEATLIAVPDLVHRGWDLAPARYLSSPPDASPLERPCWWHFLPCDPPPAHIPRAKQPDYSHFQPCGLRVVNAPTLFDAGADAAGTFTLRWTAVPGAAYIVEESGLQSFSGAEEIYRGEDEITTLLGRSEGEYYYRVRAELDGTSSDWSNGIAVLIEPETGYEALATEDYDPTPLCVVQRALVRMAAARGDLTAVLDLPAHYRENDALAHASRLKAEMGAGEAAAFSYAALYHPWITLRDSQRASPMLTRPPSGAASGILARRALSRGAWVAPANEPLAGALALDPPIAAGRLLDLLEAQINIIRQEARGFIALSADTLSDDEDLRPLNVRRLMILIRRLALKLGADYVFEPNGEEFRRMVERAFELRLGYLFQHGAFAGATAADSFQVITDEPLNNQRTRDNGQFLVELRVAPSQPLTFLIIRLLQQAERAVALEVR